MVQKKQGEQQHDKEAEEEQHGTDAAGGVGLAPEAAPGEAAEATAACEKITLVT